MYQRISCAAFDARGTSADRALPRWAPDERSPHAGNNIRENRGPESGDPAGEFFRAIDENFRPPACQDSRVTSAPLMPSTDASAPARASSLNRESIIAPLALAGIAVHLGLRFAADVTLVRANLPALSRPGRRRQRARRGACHQAGARTVRLRSARGHLHRHRGAARRVPRRLARRADAVGRPGAGGVRRRPRLVGAAGAGASHAVGRASPDERDGRGRRRSTRSRSAIASSSSRTRSARWTARSWTGTARWTSRTSRASRS